jgi:valyl-tRNA synthetase
LANEGFIAKAAADVVAGERAKLDEYRRELARTRDAIGALA